MLGMWQDISNRATDRRALQGESAKNVVEVWKAFLENLQCEVEEAERLCGDSLISGNGKMCRKCYPFGFWSSLLVVGTHRLLP